MSADEIRRKAEGVEKQRQRRSAVFFASGAVMVPSWLAVMWLLPDLRVVAGVCLLTACWIMYQVHSRGALRTVSAGLTASPSLHFYRALLEREREFHQSLPTWFLPPALLSTAAIVTGFLLTPRFAHTPVLFGVLAWIVSGTAVALVVGVKKSRREAARYQSDLDALRD